MPDPPAASIRARNLHFLIAPNISSERTDHVDFDNAHHTHTHKHTFFLREICQARFLPKLHILRRYLKQSQRNGSWDNRKSAFGKAGGHGAQVREGGFLPESLRECQRISPCGTLLQCFVFFSLYRFHNFLAQDYRHIWHTWCKTVLLLRFLNPLSSLDASLSRSSHSSSCNAREFEPRAQVRTTSIHHEDGPMKKIGRHHRLFIFWRRFRR